MRMPGFDARAAILGEHSVVQQDVERIAIQMAALHEDCPEPGFRNAQRGLSHLLWGFDSDGSQFRSLARLV